MKLTHWFFVFSFMSIFPVFAASLVTATPSPASEDENLTQDQMKEKIELLKLENDNLKLKLQLKAQEANRPPAPTPISTAMPQMTPALTPTPKPQNEEADILRAESRKAAEAAKSHKADTGLLVIDPMNEEVWYKGARFRVADLLDLIDQENWKFTQKVVAMNGRGRARNLFQCKNLSLLLYEGEDKGILSIQAPQNPGDLDAMTPEGLSFRSTNADVRDADFMDFFHYDGTDHRDGKNVLKYKHDHFLAFGDEIEFFFTREDKMTQIRFGILGER